MNIVPAELLDERATKKDLPPLLKGYLRLGATFGDGAVIDYDFNTVDVCVVVQTAAITDRYYRRYRQPFAESEPSSRDRIAWYGDMKLPGHLWRLPGLGQIRAEIVFHPAVAAADFASRKELARTCHASVAAGLDKIAARIPSRKSLAAAI